MSVFSAPLGRGRLGGYVGVGAGVGALMAGQDNRTSGAVVGAGVGSAVGAYHAFGTNMRALPGRIAGQANQIVGAGNKAKFVGDALKDAGKGMWESRNVEPYMENGIRDLVSSEGRAGRIIKGVTNSVRRFKG